MFTIREQETDVEDDSQHGRNNDLYTIGNRKDFMENLNFKLGFAKIHAILLE